MVNHTHMSQTVLHCLHLLHHWMHTQAEDHPRLCMMDPSAGLLNAKSFLDKLETIENVFSYIIF